MTDTLRPMTLGELLDRTFLLYREHFMLFVGLIALPHLALLAVQLAGVVLGRPSTSSMLLMVPITTLAYLLVVAVSQGATVIAVSRLHLGREASISSLFAGLEGRIATISLLMMRVSIYIAVGLLLLIVPGVLMALKWSLAIPVVVLEQTGGSATLSRSAALTEGCRLRILAIYFLFLVLTYIFYSLVGDSHPPGRRCVHPAWPRGWSAGVDPDRPAGGRVPDTEPDRTAPHHRAVAGVLRPASAERGVRPGTHDVPAR